MARIVPTLERMAAVYALPRDGGPSSERFTTYLREVREHHVLSMYNPMAGAPAAETVAALLALGAEDVAAEAVAGDVELALVVASPGLWTDRLATEAEHRLAPERPRPATVLLWAGEPVDAAAVAAAARAEAARVAFGPAHTVRAALAREGAAMRAAGELGEPSAAVDALLERLGDSTARADVLRIAFGDPLAEALGLEPPGLPDRAGLRWAAARSAA